jgi:transposase InsO family protein
MEALEAALGKHKPEVFNTDQGSQFTGEAFAGLPEQHGGRISMDGKGRYMDNLFVESPLRPPTSGLASPKGDSLSGDAIC